MKKKAAAVLTGMLIATGASFAGGDNGVVVGENGYKTGGFFGVRGSYVFSLQSSVIGMGNGTFFDDNYDGSGGSFGVHLGGQEGQWRATLAYEYFDNSDNQNYDLFLGQVDYLFLPTAGTVQPYIGIDLGYLNYETSGDGGEGGGMAYGGAAGLTFSLGENIDLNLELRYLFATQDEVDHVGSAGVSINYFY